MPERAGGHHESKTSGRRGRVDRHRRAAAPGVRCARSPGFAALGSPHHLSTLLAQPVLKPPVARAGHHPRARRRPSSAGPGYDQHVRDGIRQVAPPQHVSVVPGRLGGCIRGFAAAGDRHSCIRGIGFRSTRGVMPAWSRTCHGEVRRVSAPARTPRRRPRSTRAQISRHAPAACRQQPPTRCSHCGVPG